MPEKNKIPLLLILFFFLIFSLILRNTFHYFDPDLGWHLRVGQDIAQSGEVPHIIKNLYPVMGERWVDHEWLLNLASFYLYDHLGYLGLGVFFSFIAWLFFLVLYIFTCKLAKSRLVAAIFVLIALEGSAPSLGIRMQEFTAVNLLFLLILLYYYAKKPKFAYLLPLPFLFYLWVNVHGGFLIGFFVLILFLAYQIGLKIPFVKNHRLIEYFKYQELPARSIISLGYILLISIAATFFTPYGFELYSFLSTYGNTYYMTHIMEWLPAWHMPIMYWQMLYSALAAALLLIYFIEHKSEGKKTKIDLWQFVLFLVFFLLAVKSRRHFVLFAAASLPLVSALAAGFFRWPGESGILKHKIIQFYVFAAILLCLILLSLDLKLVKEPINDPNICAKFPCAAVEFMKGRPELLGQRIMNNYGWGGYLGWVWPEKKLFIDGRLPMYPLGNETYLQEYHKFFDEETIQEQIDKYRIDYFLIRRTSPPEYAWWEDKLFGLTKRNYESINNELLEYLEAGGNWEQIYSDEISLIYQRTKP